MLPPGKHYVNAPMAIAANFKDSSGNDVDPATVVFRLRVGGSDWATYTYGTDSQITRTDAGDYTATFTPDKSGRWFYRWQTTGTGTTVASEGDFLIQASEFYDDDILWDYSL